MAEVGGGVLVYESFEVGKRLLERRRKKKQALINKQSTPGYVLVLKW